MKEEGKEERTTITMQATPKGKNNTGAKKKITEKVVVIGNIVSVRESK